MSFKPYRKIRFAIERIILRGAGFQLLLISLIIGIIALTAGSLLHMSGSDLKNIGEAVWWAFLRLSDPGYLGDDHGFAKRLISLIVTISGYVIFLGSLVAIMTQWLNKTIKKLESGITPISIKGHFLILGWTSRTPTIIYQLLTSEERMSRFLQLMKKSKLRIVILTEEVSTLLVNELKEKLGKLWSEGLITFRSGNPLRVEDLQRVESMKAAAIIIPGDNFPFDKPDSIDGENLKIIMTVSNQGSDENICPDLITEIYDPAKEPIIKSAYAGGIEIIASNTYISRLIVQNLRHKGFSLVYSEILDNAGNEIYISYADGMIGRGFSEIILSFPAAIPMGILRNDDGILKPILNPGNSFIIDENDQIIVLAQDLENSRSEKSFNEPISTSKKQGLEEGNKNKHILILGWSNKIPFILNDLEAYHNRLMEVDIFSQISVESRSEIFNDHNMMVDKIKINHIEGDFTNYSDIDKIDPESYDNILMLASNLLETPEESDARTIMGYMMLQDMIKSTANPPEILIELYDEDNARLLDNYDVEIIISPLIISYIMSQVSLKKSLNIIFYELFRAGGTEIYFRNARYYGLTGNEISFLDMQYVVAGQGDILLGLKIYKPENKKYDINLNPDKKSLWKLSEKDKLIVLSE